MKLDIDWRWVKDELFKKERIAGPEEKGGAANTVYKNALGCLKKAKALVSPKAVFAEKGIIKIWSDSIEIAGPAVLSSKKIPSYIKGSNLLNLFLVTIGNSIEKEASRLMLRGEPLSGYLLDSVGSLAVESLAQKAEDALRKRYGSKDLSVSMRFSPGYCDWPIEEQKIMAKIVNFPRAGVRLTEECVMVPKKSISALVAIGPKALFSKRISQCRICDLKECFYRR